MFTLGTRGFSRVVRPKTRAAKKLRGQALLSFTRALWRLETGNRAWKASGTQGTLCFDWITILFMTGRASKHNKPKFMLQESFLLTTFSFVLHFFRYRWAIIEVCTHFQKILTDLKVNFICLWRTLLFSKAFQQGPSCTQSELFLADFWPP